jgi:SAM-dependent methyltransferase
VEFEPLASAATPPPNFSAAVAYESEESQMPADLREAYRAWHQAVTETEIVSSTLVLAGRRALGREKDQELTYGEVLFFPFYRLLEEVVRPRPGEVFADLGSGTGRAVFVAALCWPALAACKGYEVSPPLHDDARRCHGELSGSVMAPVELHCADLLRRDDWAAADIVWIASVCLSDHTLREIAARLVGLKPGARVVHMTEHFLRDDDAFERVEEDPILVEMSFGVTGVFVARRRGASE